MDDRASISATKRLGYGRRQMPEGMAERRSRAASLDLPTTLMIAKHWPRYGGIEIKGPPAAAFG